MYCIYRGTVYTHDINIRLVINPHKLPLVLLARGVLTHPRAGGGGEGGKGGRGRREEGGERNDQSSR